MENRSRVPTEAREQVHSETLGCRDVFGRSRLREHAARGERVGKGRHHLRNPRCQLAVQWVS